MALLACHCLAGWNWRTAQIGGGAAIAQRFLAPQPPTVTTVDPETVEDEEIEPVHHRPAPGRT